jgi:hypothetical protein
MAWPLDLFDPTPSPDEVRLQLARILASAEFSRAARLRDFLQHAVSCVLEGREDRLDSYAIAEAVFGRGGAFDPETDSIVRTEAARLRERLDRYYENSGRRDRVRISLNRGDYLPVFLVQPPRNAWQRALLSLRRRAWLIALAAVFSGATILYLVLHD